MAALYPITVFQAINIVENTIDQKSENHVTFRGIDPGSKVQYIFNAFDSRVSNIKKLETFKGRVTITSELKPYLDVHNIMRYSFTVLSIRMIDEIGEEITFNRKDESVKKDEPNNTQTKKPESVPVTKQKKGQIDMEAFKMFLKN